MLAVGLLVVFFVFFFFNDTATTEIYTLSLHDALPIYIDPALRRFRKELRVGHQRVRVGSKDRLVSRKLPRHGTIIKEFVRPGNEVLPVGSIGVATIMLAPRKLPVEKSRIDGRHLRSAIIFRY